MKVPEQSTDKATRKLPSEAQETARLLRQKYTRRREAIQRFTERLEKGVFPDDAEIQSLRTAGVSEPEIKALVERALAA
jgi:hypothetical protein